MPKTTENKIYKCPLCGSLLDKAKYLQIVGVWDERVKMESALKKQLQDAKELVANAKKEKAKYLAEAKSIKKEMKRQMKAAVGEAVQKGRQKEKARADRLAAMIQGKTAQMQAMNQKIKELQEQLKKGTTPQVEGLNYETELVNELRKEFPGDIIEHHGKAGDILQIVRIKEKEAGRILYECKITEKYSKSFIKQVKEDMPTRNATYGVLVTQAFKKDTAGFWVEKDILVVHPFGAIYIASVLRRAIVEIFTLSISKGEKDKRSQELMKYIKSDGFKNSVEDSMYRAKNLYEMLQKELKAHHKTWLERYENYKEIYNNVGKISIFTTNILRGLPTKESLSPHGFPELPPPEERG